METVQLYVTPPKGSVERPVMELKGFEKVKLAPGEKSMCALSLTRRLSHTMTRASLLLHTNMANIS